MIVQPLPYTDFNVIDQLESADQILTRFREDRRNISRAVNLCDLNTLFHNLVPQNEECSCKITGISATKKTCLGCAIISRLYTNGNIIVNKTITIRPGNINSGLQFYTFLTQTCKSQIRGYKQINYYPQVLQRISNMGKCGSPKATTYFSSQGTYIEHYAVISSIIEYEMNKVNIPCIPTFRWIWKCENQIGIIESIPNLGRATFNEITKNSEFLESPRSPVATRTAVLPLRYEVGRGIMAQLIVSLHFLSSYSFLFGSPSIRNIAFSRTPVDFVYQGVNIISPLTLHLIPSGTSSISLGENLRIFHPGAKCIRNTQSIEIMSGSHYKIGAHKDLFNNYINFLGFPIFTNSIDLYMFLTIFLFEEAFAHYLHNDEPVFTLVKSLFVEDEYKTYILGISDLRSSLSDKNSMPSSNDILNILSNLTLKCDATGHIWNSFASLK